MRNAQSGLLRDSSFAQDVLRKSRMNEQFPAYSVLLFAPAAYQA